MAQLTYSEYQAALDQQQGWCTTCEHVGGECVEPDAERYRCDRCGKHTVTGIEMAMIEELFELTEVEE